MDKKFLNVLLSLAAVLAIFAIVMFVLSKTVSVFNFEVDQATVGLRFLFVMLGVLIAFAVYYATKENKIWEGVRAKWCGWPSVRRCMPYSRLRSMAPSLSCPR